MLKVWVSVLNISVEEMFVKLKRQQSNQGKQIPLCTNKGDSSKARGLSLFQSIRFLMIKLLPQQVKVRKLTAGKGQVVTGRKVRSGRSKEGKLSVGQTEPEGTGLWSVEKERHSTGECLRQRDTKASKEAYQIIQGMAQLEDSIPQHLSLEIKMKLDFKVSSPLSQK